MIESSARTEHMGSTHQQTTKSSNMTTGSIRAPWHSLGIVSLVATDLLALSGHVVDQVMVMHTRRMYMFHQVHVGNVAHSPSRSLRRPRVPE